jgi:RNA polymerase sigma-70 factor, ECF subfamily
MGTVSGDKLTGKHPLTTSRCLQPQMSNFMDAYVTFRFPVAISEKVTEWSEPSAHPAREPEVSDESLLAQVRHGSGDALATLFRRYARVVRGVAYRVLRDPSEADDLLQDLFLLVQRLSGMFDSSKGSARSWILVMTYQRALCRRRYLTTRHFYDRLDLDELTEALPDPRSNAGQLEHSIYGIFGAEKAKRMFAALSENERQTLQLYFVEGHTLVEIARKTGQSIGNVRHHYFRGLEKLRKFLGSKLKIETTV